MALVEGEAEAVPTCWIQVHLDRNLVRDQRFIERETVVDGHRFIVGGVNEKCRRRFRRHVFLGRVFGYEFG